MNQSMLVMPHLLAINTLDQEKILYLLDRADYFLKTAVEKKAMLETLTGRVMMNLFFEPSTRTRNSFEIAGKRLNAIVLSPDVKQSSTIKGELLSDTIRNIESMGVELLVVRHPDNHLADFLAAESRTGIAIVNAGDGSHEHPTQALIDLMTIRQHHPDFSKLTVAIIGDVLHSRVAHSLASGLRIMGVPSVRVIAPKEFAPQWDEKNIAIYDDIDAGLQDADVVYVLRIQKERLKQSEQFFSDEQYCKQFGLTQMRLTAAKPHAIVMHAGPVIRGVEIESSVADGPQSVILQQTHNSVAVRMAVIETLMLQK